MNETAQILETLMQYLSRFLILSEEQLIAISLWISLTYVYEVGDTVPYLIVTSAEKRSGKTRVIECIQSVCNQPVVVTGLTEAVLFRIMETKPTLLIDETDTIFKDSSKGLSERQEALRAILNAGYRRGTMVYRCSPSQELIPFAVYGPKVLAGIGHLPETIEDRGICIRLKRKLSTESVERFRFKVSETEGGRIRKILQDWSVGKVLTLSNLYPEMPDELDDRAQDAYETICVIADSAGDKWGIKARKALVHLRTADSAFKESRGIRLLKDLRPVLEKLGNVYRVPTQELLDWLYREGDDPWEEWWGESGSKRAARRLAMTLAEYDVHPIQWNAEGRRGRGYAIADLSSVLCRYVPELGSELSVDEQSLPSSDDFGRGTLPNNDLDWFGTASLDDIQKIVEQEG